MEKELTIKVVFDTGEAKRRTEEYAEGSIGMLKTKANEAYAELKKMAQGTAEATEQLKKAQTYMQQYNDAIGKGQKIVIGFTGSSANAAMTMQALNYTIRDSPYFFRDFSLGLLAIGNNLNPLIDGLVKMRIESGGTSAGILFLKNHLTGITVGFSLLVAAIQGVTFALAKNKTETKNVTTEVEDLDIAIRNLSATFDQLAKAQKTFDTSIQNDVADALRKKIQAAQDLITGGRTYTSAQGTITRPLTDKERAEQQNIIDKARESLVKLGQTVSPAVEKDIQLIESFTLQMYSDKGDPKTLTKLIEKSNLSRKQLEGLASQIKWINENLFTAEGGKRRDSELSLELQKITGQLYNNVEAYKVAYDALNKYLNPPKAKSGGAKTTWIDLMEGSLDEKIEDFKNRIEEERKFNEKVNDVNKEYTKKNIEWQLDATMDEYDKRKEVAKEYYRWEAAQILENYELGYLQIEQAVALMKTLEGFTGGKIKDADKDRDDKKRKKNAEIERDLQETINREIQKGSRIANELGDSLVQAFMNGKNAGEALLVTLEAMILKMFVAYALEQLLFAGLGLFASVSAPTFNPANTLPGVSNMPTIPFNISTITPTINYSSSEITRRLDSMNMNMATQQPIVFIQADTDAIRFTKKKINPAQHNLSRGNIINVS